MSPMVIQIFKVRVMQLVPMALRETRDPWRSLLTSANGHGRHSDHKAKESTIIMPNIMWEEPCMPQSRASSPQQGYCVSLGISLGSYRTTQLAPQPLMFPCELPPHIAQYPFEIVSQRGGIARSFLVFTGYRASIR